MTKGHYSNNDAGHERFYKVNIHDSTPLSEGEDIVDINTGSYFTVFVTSAGRLFFTGERLFSALFDLPELKSGDFQALPMMLPGV